MADELPEEAIVVRGGTMTEQGLMDAAEAEYRSSGEYSISVWSLPGMDADSIAYAAREADPDALPHGKLQKTTVGQLLRLNCAMVPLEERGHYSLRFPTSSAETDWEIFMSVFDPPQPNPVKR